ncbi:MAG: hypothetical protein EON93_19100 [Burkholderiales bacterium]|nr:MAG: hypothetical protein EON93_19100 [Burkholderiales bacterium]
MFRHPENIFAAQANPTDPSPNKCDWTIPPDPKGSFGGCSLRCPNCSASDHVIAMTLPYLYLMAACAGAATALIVSILHYRSDMITLLKRIADRQRARRKLTRARRHLGR